MVVQGRYIDWNVYLFHFYGGTSTNDDSYTNIDPTNDCFGSVTWRFKPENALKLASFDINGHSKLIFSVEC